MSAPRFDSSAKGFATSHAAIDYLVAGPAPLGATGYLGWVTGASAIEIVGMLVLFLGSAWVGLLFTGRKALASVASANDSAATERSVAEGSAAADVLAALQSLPSRRQRLLFLVGLAPVILLPLLLSLIGDGGWFEMSRLRSLVLVSVVAAAFSSNSMFYWTRRSLAPARSALAGTWAGATAPGALVGGSLANRLQLAVALPALAGLVLVLDVASHEIRADAEANALVRLESVVESLARADSDRPLAERVERVLAGGRAWPVSTETFEISPDETLDSVLVGSSQAFLAELDHQLAGESRGGGVAPTRGAEIGAYRKLAGGAVLIVRVARADLADGTEAFGWGVLGVTLTVGLVSILFGTIVAREFARSFDDLRGQAAQLASGDLRPGPFDPAGDELGELAQSLFVGAAGFRATLERTVQATSRVEEIVASLSSALGGIEAVSTDQVAQVTQANRLMSAIEGRVGEASISADQLIHAIDESGNSLLELGATGDELNQTASVLTSKVDAVSDSLEQMVASVKQVGATTSRLAEASEETSSSMEEMASAMRAVDAAAETAANLSRDTVDKAEVGQAKVAQTIAGMAAIREATDVAERVVRGLGARTHEIGGILDVIEDVADETNLLALNAAIIAAQAGDQGRAFSVVADEIKELADRVLASTKEIGGLIHAVQEESENAIGAIEAGSASVTGGVDLSAEAGRTLEEITEASRESGTRIGEIVNSVREQTQAASHVVELMERVRESADQIGSAGAEQERGNEVVYRSALTMREVAQQVHLTAENQALGYGRIRENVIGVRDAVDQITGVLRDQTAACTQIAGFLAQVVAGSRSNGGAALGVNAAIAELTAEVVELREDVERFRS